MQELYCTDRGLYVAVRILNSPWTLFCCSLGQRDCDVDLGIYMMVNPIFGARCVLEPYHTGRWRYVAVIGFSTNM